MQHIINVYQMCTMDLSTGYVTFRLSHRVNPTEEWLKKVKLCGANLCEICDTVTKTSEHISSLSRLSTYVVRVKSRRQYSSRMQMSLFVHPVRPRIPLISISDLDLQVKITKIQLARDPLSKKYPCSFDEILLHGCREILSTTCLPHFWLWTQFMTLTLGWRSPKLNQPKDPSRISIAGIS